MNFRDLIEMAMLWAFGLLDDTERLEYEAALEAASPAVRAQVQHEIGRLQKMEPLFPTVEPPPRLREMVIEAVRQTVESAAHHVSPDIRVYALSAELIRAIELDPTTLHLVTPAQFEEWIADRLHRMGYEVRLTGRLYDPDGGIDLIARPRNLALSGLLAVQVKHRRRGGSVGPTEVERLASWQGSTFSMGLLVTNGRFTDQAKWSVATRSRLFMRLREFAHLATWARLNFADELALPELPQEIELRPGFKVRLDDPRYVYRPRE